MDSFAGLVAQHGYPLLALFVLLEAMGAPIPAAIALLIAGASARAGVMHLAPVILTGIGAMLAGDLMMYALGRLTGWWLLGILCRLSLNPESCILQAADAFYKRGRRILLISKFLPGINTMATPLAGSMNMPLRQFVPLDFAGITFYISAYAAGGYLFSGFLGTIQRGYSAISTVAGWVLCLAIVVWLGNRIWIWRKEREDVPVERIRAAEVGDGSEFLILDVRSHGYYDRNALRIKGSVRLDPNALGEGMSGVPRDRDILLYCTCLKEATAIRVAREMARQGFHPKVLLGGFRAWRKAGLPVEPVPAGEVVLLPKFS